MKNAFRFFFFFSLVLACELTLRAQAQTPEPVYKPSYSTIMKLGRDLYGALKPGPKELISSQPISLQPDALPFLKVFEFPDEPKPVRGVWISAGFIDLVNHIAHAKAIDLKQRGYLQKYLSLLSQEIGQIEMKPLPGDTDPKYWTDDMLNEQFSNFNSIVGVMIGINLAHHYLGHYQKYKDRLSDAQDHPGAINSLLTEQEWDEAVAKGTRNALDAGCTIEGVLPFFDSIEKMTKRPAWAIYFVPSFAKYAKLKKDLERIQKKFFAGEE